MDVKELRIGNVTDKGVIKSFYENGVHVGMGKTYLFSEIEPIPLMEEWLVRFGFELEKISHFEHYGKIEVRGVEVLYVSNQNINIKVYRMVDFTNFQVDIEFVSNMIHYVHQLQNLYFALTGEELELND